MRTSMDTSPPATFVPADDRLVAPLAHGGMWLAIGIGAGLVAICLLAWMLHAVREPVVTTSARRLTVKDHYLAEVAAVQQRFADKLIDERQLHHELSGTVRRFATEYGATGAPAMTAADLRAAGFDDVSGGHRRLPTGAVHEGRIM